MTSSPSRMFLGFVGGLVVALATGCGGRTANGSSAGDGGADEGTDAHAQGGLECPPGMAQVPSGAFWMGCDEAIDAECSIHLDELPYHEVKLSAYCIDRTEMTVSTYTACTDAGACQPPAPGGLCNWGAAGREEHPVNCLGWQKAADYCAWAGKRLPTEAEWEKAARGTDARIYPWGNDAPTCERANHDSCTSATMAVGSYPDGASPFGAQDMAGNVWEWVSDWFDENYYEQSPTADPPGPTFGQYRGVRGGSLLAEPRNLRASGRFIVIETNERKFFAGGFRCAADP